MLRLLKTPGQPTEVGWVEVVTPLGAAAHVEMNSPAHELCDDWQMLTTGRLQLARRTNFFHWFAALFQSAPSGLVAELFAANDLSDHLAALLAVDARARAHVLGLGPHVFALDMEQRELLAGATDVARRLEAGDAARAAAEEVLRGCS